MACDNCGKQFLAKAGLTFHAAGLHEGLIPINKIWLHSEIVLGH